MTNKKELDLDELENVSGGWEECGDPLVGKHVEVYYHIMGLGSSVRSHGGTVTHCTQDINGNGCYYIEFEDPYYSGWYRPSVLHGTLDSRTSIFYFKTTVK